MLRFSEYVSLGHPDKTADYISQYLLDRYIEKDPDTRYAVEVQLKGERVALGGEVSSRCHFSTDEIGRFVREAVAEVGYTPEYQAEWGADNAISSDNLSIYPYISQQSPDIAQGLSGWGDQGIFFGFCTGIYAAGPKYDHDFGMPFDHALAKRLCRALYDSRLGGIDIKTQVVADGLSVKKIIVAIPLLPSSAEASSVEEFVRSVVPGEYQLIINGTGRYTRHGSVADCGTTGRKLAVDFYGGNCRIGGGSPWTKDGSKADLTLNLLARKLAKEYAGKLHSDTRVSLACCIGSQAVDFCVEDAEGDI